MKKTLIAIVLLFPILLNAQTQLTLKNAIDTALKNNYDIQISKNFVKIATINNTYGMAGGLPNINANVSDNFFSNNTTQKYSNSIQNTTTNIDGSTINAGISANIILFNGFRVIATKKRLDYLQTQSEIELNYQIQNIIASVMIKYYDIVRQQSYLKIMENMLDVSKKKLEIINEKNKVGMANGVDLMQAQTDANAAEQNLTTQQLIITQDKADLLLLINSKSKETVIISDSIIIENNMVWDSIATYLKQNPQLLSAEQQVKIYEQLVKETSALRYPSLKMNTAYNFVKTDNNNGSLLLYQNYGPSAGLSLQIPIYNGNIYKTQKSMAAINMYNAKLEQEKTFNNITNTAFKQYLSYTTALKQIESQQMNYELAKKLVDLVLQNFKYGQATILDVKAAQTTYENEAYQLINFQFTAKIAEIELKQLMYQLSF